MGKKKKKKNGSPLAPLLMAAAVGYLVADNRTRTCAGCDAHLVNADPASLPLPAAAVAELQNKIAEGAAVLVERKGQQIAIWLRDACGLHAYGIVGPGPAPGAQPVIGA